MASAKGKRSPADLMTSQLHELDKLEKGAATKSMQSIQQSLFQRLKSATFLQGVSQEGYATTWKTAKLAFWFFLWYLFSVSYNVSSKVLVNALPQHAWTISSLQLMAGIPLFAPVWFYSRKRPVLDPGSWLRKYWKIAFMHGMCLYVTICVCVILLFFCVLRQPTN